MRRSLTRRERVTDRRRIRLLYRAKATKQKAGMRVYFSMNGKNYSRVVVCPSRGFPNAPERNRFRRRVREAYRIIKHQVLPGYDLLLQVHPMRRQLDFMTVKNILARLLGDSGLLNSG